MWIRDGTERLVVWVALRQQLEVTACIKEKKEKGGNNFDSIAIKSCHVADRDNPFSKKIIE